MTKYLNFHTNSVVMKIPHFESRRSKSLGSLRTISTTASDETAEAIAKGDKNVAHLKGVLIWAKQHQISMVLSSENNHNHLKHVDAMFSSTTTLVSQWWLSFSTIDA